MADNRKSISELTALPGNLSPNALLAIVQGGVTYHATGQQVTDMVLGNISASQLNELLQADISLRINNVGVIAQVSGRLQITAVKPPGTTGIVELTAPAGWVWHSAIGGAGTSAIRSVSVENNGSQTITVHVFSSAGNPIDAAIVVQGTLVPA